MAEMKTYALRVGSKEDHFFTGRSPRQAALKAATRGITSIVLRERAKRNSNGTYSLHVFKGTRKQVSAPDNAPSWLPAKVWKPVVKKVEVKHIDKL